jgi:hypothetical protein
VARASGLVAIAQFLDAIVPEQVIDVGGHLGILVNRCRNERNAAWRWLSSVFTLLPRRRATAARFRPSTKVSRMI